MDSSTVVTMNELRVAVGLLLDEVERRLGATIDLGADYYWEIDAAVAFGHEPIASDAITAGQLSDDVASLREFINRPPSEVVAVWHEASHLAGTLRRLGAMDLPGR